MSQETLEVTRRSYEAFNRGDVQVMVDDLAPNFEYVGTHSVPGMPRDYRGADGWLNAVSWLLEEFDHARVEVRGLIEAEEGVLAEITLHGRGKRSGADASWDMCQLWTFEDGRILRGQGYQNREEALRAAGLTS